MFDWNSDSVKWRQEANLYTGFYTKLSELIIPMLEKDDSVCDIGCGLGQVSAEIARHVHDVTAVDTSQIALDCVQKYISNMRQFNVFPRQGTWEEFEGRWDVLLLCYFGRLTENIVKFGTLYSRRLIAVVGDKSVGPFYPSKFRDTCKQSVTQVDDFLIRKGYLFYMHRSSLEFGQPFDNMDEAIRFICHYAPRISKEEASTHLERTLVINHYGGAKLYLPHEKRFGIFSLAPLKPEEPVTEKRLFDNEFVNCRINTDAIPRFAAKVV